MPSKKHQNDKDGAAISLTKINIETVDTEGKYGEIWLKNQSHLLFQKKED